MKTVDRRNAHRSPASSQSGMTLRSPGACPYWGRCSVIRSRSGGGSGELGEVGGGPFLPRRHSELLAFTDPKPRLYPTAGCAVTAWSDGDHNGDRMSGLAEKGRSMKRKSSISIILVLAGVATALAVAPATASEYPGSVTALAGGHDGNAQPSNVSSQRPVTSPSPKSDFQWRTSRPARSHAAVRRRPSPAPESAPARDTRGAGGLAAGSSACTGALQAAAAGSYVAFRA